MGITLAPDGSEVKILIAHYPMLKEYQVMAEQIEQPADEQSEGMNDTKTDDNSNNSDEEDEEEIETAGKEYIKQKAYLKNDENSIDFRWFDIWGEDEEDIAKANLIESLQKQADEENLS